MGETQGWVVATSCVGLLMMSAVAYAAAPTGASPDAGAPASPAARRADDPALSHGFVYLADIAPGIRVDLRYARADNFVGRPVRGYGAGRCLVTRRTAAALSRAERALEAGGYRLEVYDCYRPKRAVDDFVAWSRTGPVNARTPEHNPAVPKGELFRRGYIAPRSGHSRGSTIDVTLLSKASELVGSARAAPPASPDCRAVSGPLAPDGTLNMGTTFDCFDERAHANADVPPEARRNRGPLARRPGRSEGFVGYYEGVVALHARGRDLPQDGVRLRDIGAPGPMSARRRTTLTLSTTGTRSTGERRPGPSPSSRTTPS